MSDRENVIKNLEICSSGHCEGCTYHKPCGLNLCCWDKLMMDAVRLLKEQEAVTPKEGGIKDNPFLLYLAFYAPAPENAPDDWVHHAEDNLKAWKDFVAAAEERGYYILPVDEKEGL